MITRLADRLRGLLAQLGPGSQLLALRLVGRFGWKVSLAGAVVLLYAAARYRTWITWGVIAWCAAALVQKPDEQPDEPNEDEPEANEEPPAEAPPTPAGPPRVSSVELVAAVRDIGTPHAQLKPLADHLRTTTDAVRTAAAGVHWSVKDVRMQGRSASAGLRWDEAPPGPAALLPDVVGAGQPADDDNDDTPEGGPREGVRVVRTDSGLTVYDPADAHRRHDLRKI